MAGAGMSPASVHARAPPDLAISVEGDLEGPREGTPIASPWPMAVLSPRVAVPLRFPSPSTVRSRVARCLLIAALGTLAPAQALLADLRPGWSTIPLWEVESFSAHGSGMLLAVRHRWCGVKPWWWDGVAAEPWMLKDIGAGGYGSQPSYPFTLGGRAHFFAEDRGMGLWRTDGTTAGTVQVAAPAIAEVREAPVVVGGVAYFFGWGWNGTGFARSLWRTDGTAAGTVPVITGLSLCRGLCGVGTRLFFTESDQNLWTSDGTTAGTFMLRTFANPGQERRIGEIADLGGRALFAADDCLGGRPLWISDGTVAGTGLLLPPGMLTANGEDLAVLNGRAYFAGDEPAFGAELWATDGTAAGTSRVLDLTPGPGGSYPCGLFAAASQGLLYFTVGSGGTPSTRELYVTDGTTAGTRLVDLGPGGIASGPENFADLGGFVMFGAGDAATGSEPWVSCGSTAATWSLGDLYPGSLSSRPGSFVRVGGGIFFSAYTFGSDREVFATDLTPAGTRRPFASRPLVPETSSPRDFVNAHGAGWFTAVDASGIRKLMASDGSSATTRSLMPLDPVRASLGPPNLVRLGDAMIVLGTWSNQTVLRVDISGSASQLRTASSSTASTGQLRGTDDLAYFIGSDQTAGREPWCTDGTVAGTHRIFDIHPQFGSMDPSRGERVGTLGGRFLFAADDGIHGLEPWVSDGTAAGTFLLADVCAGSYGSTPQCFCDMGDYALFQASDGVHGAELWRTDGTVAGTFLLADVVPSPGWYPLGSEPDGITRVGDHAYFAAGLPSDRELWRTDGTTAGTVRVFDAPNGEVDPMELVAARGKLFFTGHTPGEGRELWVSDGTAAGTVRLTDLRPGPGTGAGALAAAGTGHVVFQGSTPDAGAEAWVSDGTVAGTVPLAEVVPGPGSSNPGQFVQAGRHLYWCAFDLAAGYEPFSVPLAAFGGSSWEPYGGGCGGASGVPVAGMRGTPILGSPDLAWTLRRAAPSTACFLRLGVERADVPLGGGCHSLIGGVTVCFVGLTDGSGRCGMSMPVPVDPRLAGLSLFGQFAVLEPGGPLAGMGTASAGIHVLIGR